MDESSITKSDVLRAFVARRPAEIPGFKSDGYRLYSGGVIIAERVKDGVIIKAQKADTATKIREGSAENGSRCEAKKAVAERTRLLTGRTPDSGK